MPANPLIPTDPSGWGQGSVRSLFPHGMQSVTQAELNATLGETVAPAPYIDKVSQVTPGSDLSPQLISGVFAQANIGYLYLAADLFDGLRECDAHLHSVLCKRELQVSGAPWSIVPEDPEDLEAQRIADWCERELRELRGFADVLAHLQGGVYYGHSICEQIWVPVQGRWRLSKIQPLHPRRFAYASRTWDLCLWDQTGNELVPDLSVYPGIPLNAFPPGKFLAHTPRVRGGYPQREGLGRVLAWYSCFKRFGIRDWLALCEWAGRGLRIGTYKTGTADKTERATPEHQQALRKALNDISSSLSVVIADTTELEIKELQHPNNTIHESIVKMCDSQMSKATLGGTLTTDPGERGARSLGDNQMDEQKMIALADAGSLSATVRWGLLSPMVRYRWGLSAKIPLFKLHVEQEENLDAKAQRIERLAKAGADIPQAYVAEQFGYPMAKPGEAILVPNRSMVKVASEGAGAEPEGVAGASGVTGQNLPASGQQVA